MEKILKNFRNTIFIYILVTCGFTSITFSSLIWAPHEAENIKKTVLKIGNTLKNEYADKCKGTSPNVATLYLKFQDDSKKFTTIEIPHFFLSGWDKTSYHKKVHKDIDVYIQNLMDQNDNSYMYKCLTIGDFFLGKEKGELEFEKHINNFLEQKISISNEEDFKHHFYHSEQAILLFLQSKLSDILQKNFQNQDKIHIECHILSYWPLCPNCKTTITNFENLLNTTEKFTIKILVSILKISESEKDKEDSQHVDKKQKHSKIEDESKDLFTLTLNSMKYGCACPEILEFFTFESKPYKKSYNKLTNNQALTPDDKKQLNEKYSLPKNSKDSQSDAFARILFIYNNVFCEKDRKNHEDTLNHIKKIREILDRLPKQINKSLFFNTIENQQENIDKNLKIAKFVDKIENLLKPSKIKST